MSTDDDIDHLLTDLCERVTEERCVPFLLIKMDVQENVGLPREQLRIEETMSEILRYQQSRIYSAIRSGPATHGNIAVIVEFNPAEVWSSLNRKVEDLQAWADRTDLIEDPGRDLSVLINAGDPEHEIREYEVGQRR